MARSQQIAGDVGHEDFMDHVVNPLDSGGTDLTAEERVPKMRKAYTISKQREKWTEHEHKLFLESLQLHGRAWRRIQEHIGSKTSVQIRSHAQKFFSKVIRESVGDGNSVATAPQINIPPPRPKRRPAHPYPRKMGNSAGKAVPALKQLEKPQLQIRSLFEQESGSPKSVFSTTHIDSETLASDGGGSPASSVVDIEERCPTPSTASVEFDVEETPSKAANGNTGSVPEGAVLRLFGKRVVVNDLQQQTNSNTEDLQNSADMEVDASSETPTSGTRGFSSHGAAEANTWSMWMNGAQQFMYYLPEGEVLSVHSGQPFFSYNQGSMPFPVVNKHAVASNQQQHQQLSQTADRKFMSEEGSSTESNTNSSSVPETIQSSDSVESIQASSIPGSRKYASLEGFLPYKKCVAKSMVQRPSEETDGEMTRLCL